VNELSLDEQIESLFPVGGPYGDEPTRAAGASIAALVRYLNHATWHDSATPYPSTVDSLVRSLSAAVAGLDQLLRQLIDDRLPALTGRPGAYATGSQPVRQVVSEVADHLDDARGHLHRAQQAIGRGRVQQPPWPPRTRRPWGAGMTLEPPTSRRGRA
jgi:hypothetical protein